MMLDNFGVTEDNWRESLGAREYGFMDIDGAQPDIWRHIQEVEESGGG